MILKKLPRNLAILALMGMSVLAHADQALKELEGYVIDNAQAIVDAKENRQALQRDLRQLREEKQQLKATVDKLLTRLDQLTKALEKLAGVKENKYVELIHKTVNAFEERDGNTSIKIFDATIDTSGYSEIRVRFYLYLANYQRTHEYFTNQAKIEVYVEPNGSSFIITKQTLSQMYGVFTEKIISNKAYIHAWTKKLPKLPKGPYELKVTYYLVK